MKFTTFFFAGGLLTLLLAAGGGGVRATVPAPIIVGTVHDQTGVPVAGARITAGSASAVSDIDGTFSLAGSGLGGARNVRVTCKFCGSITAAVGEDGTVVAIVHRYAALANSVPTSDDLASLPYANIESAVSLTPFTVLENFSNIFPGPLLTDRGAANTGGLIFDAHVPEYDSVAGVSPLYAIPQRYVQNIDVLSTSDAFRYGSLADAGMYVLDPQSVGEDAHAITGGTQSFRAGTSSDIGAVSVGASGNATEQRRRADASAQTKFGDVLASISLDASNSAYVDDPSNVLNTNGSGFHASLEQIRTFDVRADIYSSSAGYDARTHGIPVDELWNDTFTSVTVASLNPVITPCVSFGFGTDSGYYLAQVATPFHIAGAITQGRAVAGVTAHGTTYAVTAGIGTYAIGYSGGAFGVSTPSIANLTAPELHVQFTPDTHWSFDASASGGFRLPYLSEHYSGGALVMPPSPSITTLPGVPLVYDKDMTFEGTLEYSDAARMKIGLTALERDTSGLDLGRTVSAGASFSWQVAPTISLRTWWLRVTPDLMLTMPVFRFTPAAQPVSVGSAWLSYENANNLRLDVIWRQDEINYLPDPHLDAPVSAPLLRNVRWYAGTERYQGDRSYNIGLRFVSF